MSGTVPQLRYIFHLIPLAFLRLAFVPVLHWRILDSATRWRFRPRLIVHLQPRDCRRLSTLESERARQFLTVSAGFPVSGLTLGFSSRFAHRAAAAIRPISLSLCGEIRSFRTLPEALPPREPSWTAAGFLRLGLVVDLIMHQR